MRNEFKVRCIKNRIFIILILSRPHLQEILLGGNVVPRHP